jgi:hypothetical protein
MDLDQWTNRPVDVEIDGKTYQVAELPIEELAYLQEWIRKNVPDPIKAVAPYLGSLRPEDRAVVLDQARQDAARWPPKVGSTRAAEVLLGTEEGQAELLWRTMRVHRPDLTREETTRMYRQWLRDASADEAIRDRVGEIYAIALGLRRRDEEPAPKG